MIKLTNKDIERFWSKVDVKGEDECWEWKKCKDKDGYGQYQINKKKYLSHRISWILENGDIPKKMCICHKCDNPSCVNPNHLFLGTNKNNSEDMTNKNRQAKGENQGLHKLTEKQILEIRLKYIPYKYTQQKLAEEYNISRSLIGYIVRNKIWKHI